MANELELKVVKETPSAAPVDVAALTGIVRNTNIGSAAKMLDPIESSVEVANYPDNARSLSAALNLAFSDARDGYERGSAIKYYLYARLAGASGEPWWKSRILRGVASSTSAQFHDGIINDKRYFQAVVTHEPFWFNLLGPAKLSNGNTPGGTYGFLKCDNSYQGGLSCIAGVDMNDFLPDFNSGDMPALPQLAFKNSYSAEPRRVYVGLARGTMTFNPWVGSAASQTWATTAAQTFGPFAVSGTQLASLMTRAVQPIITLGGVDTYGSDLRAKWYLMPSGYATVQALSDEVGFESGHQLQALAAGEIVQGDWSNATLSDMNLYIQMKRYSGASTTVQMLGVHLLPRDGWGVYSTPGQTVAANAYAIHDPLMDINGVMTPTSKFVPGQVDYYGAGFQLVPREKYTFVVLHEKPDGTAPLNSAIGFAAYPWARRFQI